MESSAIAVLVPPATAQNGVLAVETPSVQSGDGAPSPFSRMLGGAAGVPQSATGSVAADTVLQIMIPVSAQLTAGGEEQLETQKAGALRSSEKLLATLLAFQAAPSSPLGEAGLPPLVGETITTEANTPSAAPVQNDAGETAIVQKNAEESSGGVRKADDASTESAELMVASAMQILTSQPPAPPQAQTPSPLQSNRPESDTKAQAVPKGIPFDGASAVVREQVRPDPPQNAGTPAQAPVGNNVELSFKLHTDIPGTSTVTGQPPAGTVAPAPAPVPAVAVAGMANEVDKAVPVAATVDASGEVPAVEGDVRVAQVTPAAGKAVKSSPRGGHEPGIQKGESPAPTAEGQVYNRPLLEVVVEGVEAEPSAESAGRPVKVETASEATVGGKTSHSLIGGVLVTKAEPTPVAAAGEAVRSPSHEQILAQVKEQIDKAGSRVDDGRVVLRLHPDELGSLRIDVKMDDQKLRLHIVAENPTVREALVANLDSLKESLSKQQIVMERFDVATGQGQHQQQFLREHRQQVHQDGQAYRANRSATEYAEDAEVVNRQAMNAYWAPQESSLLNVRF